MPYRTLGDLRSILLGRLGMGAMGASGGANLLLIDSFLQEGQNFLYWMQAWKHLQDYKDITTGVGQNLYDYPTAGTMDATIGCALHKRVLRVEVNIAGQFTPVHEGITTEMWSTMDTQSSPERFERFKQILVYPKANQAYTMRVWFVGDLQPFTGTDDEATLDDSMILLHATAMAKAHYRQPDASTYQGQLDQLLARIRGQSFGSDGVYRRDDRPPPERKPALLGRDA